MRNFIGLITLVLLFSSTAFSSELQVPSGWKRGSDEIVRQANTGDTVQIENLNVTSCVGCGGGVSETTFSEYTATHRIVDGDSPSFENIFVDGLFSNGSGIRTDANSDTNTKLGFGAGVSITSGTGILALGGGALGSNTTGNSNIAVGPSSLLSNIAGSANVSVGVNSCRSVLGTGNICLGTQAGRNETGSNKLYIDNSSTATPLIYGDFLTDELTINGALASTGDLTTGGDLTGEAGIVFAATTTIYGNYSAVNNKYMVFINSSTSPSTLYLPPIVSSKGGVEKRFYKDDTSSNIVTISAAGSDTIGGNSTISMLTEEQSLTLKAENGEWKPIQKGSSGLASITYKSYAISQTSVGVLYAAGFYHGDVVDLNLTQASPTGVHGTTNEPSGAHAFVVFGAYTAEGGTGSARIEISGTSFTPENGGTRVESDSEIVALDLRSGALNKYYETVKRWLGQITYTLICDGSCTHTTFSADFNVGHAKYDDLGSNGRLGFTIEDIEVVGLAGANDAAFDVDLVKHDGIGWTYHASAFVPGNGNIASLDTSYGTESDLATGQSFSFKIEDIGEFIDVASITQKEGYLIKITTGANNAITYATAHVGSRLP